MSVNRIAREDGHLYLYDFEVLAAMLREAGFVDVERQRFRRGRDPKLLLDTEARALETLYVEAVAP